MGHAHYFAIENLGAFLAGLEKRHYVRTPGLENGGDRVVYSKTLSDALVKRYSYTRHHPLDAPVQIRVSYTLLESGGPLKRLSDHLKRLNADFRQTLILWKTKSAPRADVRTKRLHAIQDFLTTHSELISCYRYEGDELRTEGNPSFNMYIAATPSERAICFEFIKALLEAYVPNSIARRRRQADLPRQQRDGWIKRYAVLHRKRGWSPQEVIREIQKELRDGTWNERSRLQYNLADNTIGRIAGMKLHPVQV